MNAPINIHPPTHEDIDVATIASLVRTIERAPVQNRLPIFAMMTRMVVADLNASRQRAIDDLRDLARDVGLIDLLGATTVETALAVEFEKT
jgi:hypothetical protein